jgi:two-component system copper resistance phosphate regulon response regulator CusR
VRPVLVADGDEAAARGLEHELRRWGFATHVVLNRFEAEERALVGAYELLILDLGGPAGDWLDALRSIRAAGRMIPVIVLSGRAVVSDAERCLDAGADDYMVKPFRYEELRARIDARLRPDRPPGPTTLLCDGVRLDHPSRHVTARGRRVDLTAKEFTLLELLMRHKGQTLTRRQIIAQVWSSSVDPSSNVVDVCVVGLRRKLDTDAIEAIRGVGYRFRDGAAASDRTAGSADDPTAAVPPSDGALTYAPGRCSNDKLR